MKFHTCRFDESFLGGIEVALKIDLVFRCR